MKDQVEILTHDKSQTETHPRDVEKILSELPVQEQQERSQVLDSVTAEENEASGKSHAFQDLETVLTWIGYAAAVGVAVALTWAVISSVSQSMPH